MLSTSSPKKAQQRLIERNLEPENRRYTTDVVTSLSLSNSCTYLNQKQQRQPRNLYSQYSKPKSGSRDRSYKKKGQTVKSTKPFQTLSNVKQSFQEQSIIYEQSMTKMSYGNSENVNKSQVISQKIKEKSNIMNNKCEALSVKHAEKKKDQI